MEFGGHQHIRGPVAGHDLSPQGRDGGHTLGPVKCANTPRVGWRPAFTERHERVTLETEQLSGRCDRLHSQLCCLAPGLSWPFAHRFYARSALLVLTA